MSGYALYAVAVDDRFRVFATTSPVEPRLAGEIAARRFRELGLPSATAAGVSATRPGSHALLLTGPSIVHAITLLDSERVEEFRHLAAIGEGALLLVPVEPLEIVAPAAVDAVTWCPRCLDQPLATGERRCRACQRLDLLLHR